MIYIIIFSFSSSKGELKAVFKDAMLQTTIKGIPRAVKAERRLLRALWVISTMVFVGLALYQAFDLTYDFLKFEYFTISSDVTIQESNDMTPNPAITICNLNNFAGNASSLIDELGIMPLGIYEHKVEVMTACPECSPQDAALLTELRDDLLAPHGYYAYIGKTNASKISHKYETFIVGCYLHQADGFRSHLINCSNLDIKEIMTPDYYTCHTLQFSNSSGGSITGISLVLHLDNFFVDQYDHLNVNYEQGQFLGAVLALHEMGKFPVMRHKAVFLPPGFYSDIKIRLSVRQRIAQPFSNCTYEQYVPNTTYTYTSEECVSSCLEAGIVYKCNCLDLYTLNILQDVYLEQGNVTFCMDPEFDRDDILARMRCAREVRSEMTMYCYSRCPLSCDDTLFSPQLSTSAWPPNPYHDEFYESYVAGRPYEWRYSNLSNVVYSVGDIDTAERTYVKELVDTNFLRVDVSLKEVSYVQNNDLAKTSFSSYLSQLGGTLNLFAGISFIIIVEFFDLLITLFCTKHDKSIAEVQPTQNQNSSTTF